MAQTEVEKLKAQLVEAEKRAEEAAAKAEGFADRLEAYGDDVRKTGHVAPRALVGFVTQAGKRRYVCRIHDSAIEKDAFTMELNKRNFEGGILVAKGDEALRGWPRERATIDNSVPGMVGSLNTVVGKDDDDAPQPMMTQGSEAWN